MMFLTGWLEGTVSLSVNPPPECMYSADAHLCSSPDCELISEMHDQHLLVLVREARMQLCCVYIEQLMWSAV